MSEREKPWSFFGIELEEGRPVQDWFNGLEIEAQEEISDLVEHLRVRRASRWDRPDFDPLEGEGGISEIRPTNMRGDSGSKTLRVYGIMGYPEQMCYTFLHGTGKDVKNDRDGKDFAKHRLKQLSGEFERRGKPAVHEFDFEGKSYATAESGAGRTIEICRVPPR
jgi:hypothetical protein